MKLTRVGFVMLAVMALTLLASATAVQGAKAPKRPHYKVLVVTAGDKKSDVNKAGVKAIREIGKDDGTKHDPNSKFSVDLAQDQHQIDDQFTDEAPRPLQRRHLPRHGGVCPAQRRAEGRLRGVLPQRRRLPRDRLGNRDRARPGSSTPTSSARARRRCLLPHRQSADTNIKVVGTGGLAVGRTISIDTGANNESATILTVGTAGAAGTGVTLTAPLTLASRERRDRRAAQAGGAVGDDQGRRPRSRRDEEPARVLGPDGRLVELHGQRPRRLARPRDGRRGSVRPAAAGPGARRNRRRHDGRRPSGLLVQGLPGRPLLLHRARQHREQLDEADLRSHLDRRDRLGGRRGRQGLQRLRRDRARELPAGQDQRPPNLSEPIGFDQLPDGRIIQTDRRGAMHLHDPVTTRDVADFVDPSPSAALHQQRGRAVRPGGRQQLRDQPLGLPLLLPADVDGHQATSDGTIGSHEQTTGLRPVEQRRPDPGRRRLRLGSWIGYFQLSRFKFVDDAPGDPAHLDLASEQQILRVTDNRGACCHVAGDIDFDKHNNLWVVDGRRQAGRQRRRRRLRVDIDQRTDENADHPRDERDRRHVHADVQRPDDRPARVQLDRRADRRRLWRRSATSGASTFTATGGPVNTANVRHLEGRASRSRTSRR